MGGELPNSEVAPKLSGLGSKAGRTEPNRPLLMPGGGPAGVDEGSLARSGGGPAGVDEGGCWAWA